MHAHTNSRVALAREGVALQSRLYRNVGDEGAAAAALNGDPRGLGSDARGTDHNPRNFHQASHVL